MTITYAVGELLDPSSETFAAHRKGYDQNKKI
jgi:hypothetical protein